MHADNVHGQCSHECSGLFRIETADQEDQSEDSNKERDIKVDEGHSGKVHASGESHDPGIVSPAVYVTTFPLKLKINPR